MGSAYCHLGLWFDSWSSCGPYGARHFGNGCCLEALPGRMGAVSLLPLRSLTCTPRAGAASTQPRCPTLGKGGRSCSWDPPTQAEHHPQSGDSTWLCPCGKHWPQKAIRCTRLHPGGSRQETGRKQAGPGQCLRSRWMEGDLITRFASAVITVGLA